MERGDHKKQQNPKSEIKRATKKTGARAKPASVKLKDDNRKLKRQNKELQEKLLRLAAEFDNYKKRAGKEYLTLIQNANERLILELLPILDDMERSLNHLHQSQDLNSILEGYKLIYKNLYSTLEKQGLKPMEAIGTDFDPDKHDALMQVEKKGAESEKVIEEHLKGYYLKDKVIRHAQVIVSK